VTSLTNANGVINKAALLLIPNALSVEHVLHMQKSLDQMNLQLHHVLSEITGLSGLRILDAILAGERNPIKLAELCHWRVKSSRDTVAKALEGDYRPEHLFVLKQSPADYRDHQQQIGEVDKEIHQHLADLPPERTPNQGYPKRTKKYPYEKRHYDYEKTVVVEIRKGRRAEWQIAIRPSDGVMV
jgi:hypothetical protein